jgi:hypothetical protein
MILLESNIGLLRTKRGVRQQYRVVFLPGLVEP